MVLNGNSEYLADKAGKAEWSRAPVVLVTVLTITPPPLRADRLPILTYVLRIPPIISEIPKFPAPIAWSVCPGGMATLAATLCIQLSTFVVTPSRDTQSGIASLTLEDRETPCSPDATVLNVTVACWTSSDESQLS